MSAAAAPTVANTRRLHPVLAFLAGVLGFGYVYVGRIGFAIAYVLAPFAILYVGGWTRWLVHPLGWYPLTACVLLVALVALIHPVVLAWRRPVVPRKRYNRWWVYLAWVIGFNVIFDAVIGGNRADNFGYDLFRIPSAAMDPTLQSGDWIVVDSWRYRTESPAFGDIVIHRTNDGIALVKRLVGLPGDTLEMRGRVLVRNGSPVDEPYLHDPIPGLAPRGLQPLTLGPDEYFVLGDNRDNSNDSRYNGPIGRAEIVGRTEFIALSFSGGLRWERFSKPLTVD